MVKGLVLSLLWLLFDTWPGNFHMLQVQAKKKKSIPIQLPVRTILYPTLFLLKVDS